MIRTAFLIVACVGVTAGCPLLRMFNQPPLPPRELYRLKLADTATALQAVNGNGAPLAGSVAIAPYETPGLYGESGIVFRVGASSYGAYPSREWALPLGEMLGTLTESVFLRAPISTEQAVYDPPSRNSHVYTWRGSVREFEEVNLGQAVSVAVRLDVKLVRSADDSLIWSGSARLERPVSLPSDRMENVVATLSDAAIEVINKLGRQAVAEIAMAPGSSAATPRP